MGKNWGREGEEIAAKFLSEKGFEIIQRNFRFGHGEIDIVAKAPDDYLVFIEVKLRRSNTYGEAEYSITLNKQKQIKRIAACYLYVKQLSDIPCRFDVVVITGESEENREITHYIDAFR